jgi:small subunit ribosomal protein S5
MVTIPMTGATIPHEVIGEHGAGKVLMKPAAPGAGVIAGGAVRAVMECAGIADILTKSLGSTNPHNMVLAAMDGLGSLTTHEQIAKERGVELSAVPYRSRAKGKVTANA